MPEARIAQAGESRLTRIESLRALAALGVLVGHTYGAAFPPGTQSHFGRVIGGMLFGGGFGVNLFFCLTGYLLYRPFARASFAGGPPSNLGRYFLNRAARILPLYFSAVIILVLVQYHGASLKQWLIFAAMGQTLFPSQVPLVDGPLWSVIVEVHFYILLPLFAIVMAEVSRRRVDVAILLMLVLAIVGVFAYGVLEPVSASGYQWRFSLVANFGFFASGMLLALVQIRGLGAAVTGPLARSDIWFMVAMGLWLLVLLTYSPWFAMIAGVVTVGAAVLPPVHGGFIRALEWRPLAVLGVASYSLYVWHQPIINALSYVTGLTGSFYIRLAVTFAVSCLVALASYRVLEAPWLRLRQSWSSSTLVESPVAEAG